MDQLVILADSCAPGVDLPSNTRDFFGGMGHAVIHKIELFWWWEGVNAK
jgi:hypothetical protein